jgi:hypothetical protein
VDELPGGCKTCFMDCYQLFIVPENCYVYLINYSKISNQWDVSEGVKADGLVAGVVTGHVALAAVDAHLRINQGHNMLPKQK